MGMGMEFLIAGILATVAGTAGMINSLIEDDKAEKQINDEIDYLDELYSLEEKSLKDSKKNALDTKELSEKKATTERDNDLAYTETTFQNDKEAAYRQADKLDIQAKQLNEAADLADVGQDIAERSLAVNFNSAIDNLYLSQTQDAMSWNAQGSENLRQTGAGYAGLAASGIRAGSSLSDAVLMQSAENGAQLQFSQDAKRRSDSNNLAGVLNGLAGGMFDVRQNRIAADTQRFDAGLLQNDAAYTRNSFLEGGGKWNLYQQKISGINDTYNINLEIAQNTYNNRINELTNNWNTYEKTYKYKKNALEDELGYHTGINKAWHAGAALLSAGGTGFSTGYNLGKNIFNS
jgi:hypothetical protein